MDIIVFIPATHYAYKGEHERKSETILKLDLEIKVLSFDNIYYEFSISL